MNSRFCSSGFKGFPFRGYPDEGPSGWRRFLYRCGLAGLGLACEKGLTLGVLIHNFTIDEVTEVAKRLPELKIMINHLGGLSITHDPLATEWKNSIKRAAAQPNVHCKVSGIFQRSGSGLRPRNDPFTLRSSRSFWTPLARIVLYTEATGRLRTGEELCRTNEGDPKFLRTGYSRKTLPGERGQVLRARIILFGFLAGNDFQKGGKLIPSPPPKS